MDYGFQCNEILQTIANYSTEIDGLGAEAHGSQKQRGDSIMEGK